MKNIIVPILGAVIAPTLFAAEYSMFRVCEDKHVLRTSDGADAGRVEYIVLDPASQQIVSTVVTGGVVGSKYVAVPFSSMRFTNDREIALTEIDRERIVSAPVIERTQITSNVIEPTYIERTNNYFGVRADVNSRTTTNIQERDRARTGASVTQENTPGGRAGTAGPGSKPGEKMPPDAPATSQKQKRTTEAGSKQPGENPPGIGEKLPDKENPANQDAQGRQSNQRNADRAAEPQAQRRDEARPGDRQNPQPDRATDKEGSAAERATDKAKQESDRATEKARQEAGRAQDQGQSLKDQAERKAGAKEQSQPKPGEAEKKKPNTEEPRQ